MFGRRKSKKPPEQEVRIEPKEESKLPPEQEVEVLKRCQRYGIEPTDPMFLVITALLETSNSLENIPTEIEGLRNLLISGTKGDENDDNYDEEDEENEANLDLTDLKYTYLAALAGSLSGLILIGVIVVSLISYNCPFPTTTSSFQHHRVRGERNLHGKILTSVLFVHLPVSSEKPCR